jgi:hypothetical protein
MPKVCPTAFDLVNRRCLQHSQRLRHFLPHLRSSLTQQTLSLQASRADTRSTVSMKAHKADHSSFSNPEEVVVRHSHFGEHLTDAAGRICSLKHLVSMFLHVKDTSTPTRAATLALPHAMLSCRAVCGL